MLDENPVLVLLHWWKDIGRVNPKYSQENPFRWYFVNHTPYVDWTAIGTVGAAVDYGE